MNNEMYPLHTLFRYLGNSQSEGIISSSTLFNNSLCKLGRMNIVYIFCEWISQYGHFTEIKSFYEEKNAKPPYARIFQGIVSPWKGNV